MTEKKYLYLVETDRGHRYTVAVNPHEAFEKVKQAINSGDAYIVKLQKITVVAEEGLYLVA